MFGEEVIVVNRTISIDAKRRIILPKETGAVAVEKIYCMHNAYQTRLSLYSEKYFEVKLNDLLNELERLYRAGKFNYQKYHDYRLYLCAILSYPYEIIDKQRRIMLPAKAIETMNIKSSVYIRGNEHRLDLYSSEEEFNKLKKIRHI